MTISIITPNFNSATFIQETYQSICNQTYSNWEWIVVDDGSTDNSPDLIQEWAKEEPRIKFCTRTQLPKGASACRNMGIEHAQGEYLLFLDADDLLEPFCLEQRLQYMKQNPSLDFAVFKMGYFHTSIGDIPGIVNHFNNDNHQYLRDFISYHIPWQTSCPIWKREYLIKNNIRFSEKYQRLQDPEFHAKILLLHQPAFKVLKDSEVDCYYRQSHITKNNNTVLLKKTITGFLVFYEDFNNYKNEYPVIKELLNSFITITLKNLLFYFKLYSYEDIKHYLKNLKAINPHIKSSNFKYFVFYIFNKTGLSFVKGAGISRIWALLNKE